VAFAVIAARRQTIDGTVGVGEDGVDAGVRVVLAAAGSESEKSERPTHEGLM
jgi:hypothetical protein